MLQEMRMCRFMEAYEGYKRRELSCEEAGLLLGMSERQFRRLRGRYEDEGAAGVLDRRLGRASPRRVPACDIAWVVSEYKSRYAGFTVKHFHEKMQDHPQFNWGYTWTKNVLQAHGGVSKAPRRGAHRRKRERRPLPGMMLHQDGSRHDWLGTGEFLDLIVTLDDATSGIYSAFLVEEESTASTFAALAEVIEDHGLPCSLYTDRGSHYFLTRAAGGKVDKSTLTQVGRAFGTLQDRLVRELALAGIKDIDEANQFIRDVYIPAHNKRFAVPPTQEGSAFVPVAGSAWRDVLSVQEERQVGNDNTVRYKSLILQLPPVPERAHFVRATVRVHQYPNGALAVFHGPRRLSDYTKDGVLITKEEKPVQKKKVA